MATRLCLKCGGELEPYAGICPHCGALTPMLTGQAGAHAPLLPADQPSATQRATAALQSGGLEAPRGRAPVDRRSAAIGALAGSITVVIVLVVILLVVHGMQSSTTQRSTARGGESKQGLHDVQLALEKYYKDNSQYPAYLIGGEARYAAAVVSGDPESAFLDIRDCNRSSLSDPLLREGYLDKYPANPFLHNGLQVHMVQTSIPSSSFGEDPLRNDYPDGEQQGTRFGATCTTMGNVLADQRYPGWLCQTIDYGMTTISTCDTFANIEYPYWDVWVSEQPLPYLPGEFFYKSAGPLAPPAGVGTDMAMGPPQPVSVDYYMLGAYGSSTDQGQDVLGAEPQISFKLKGGKTKLWPWTRSTDGSSTSRDGSPYGAAKSKSSPCYPFEYGNPNGISDAVILVLTAK